MFHAYGMAIENEPLLKRQLDGGDLDGSVKTNARARLTAQ